MTHQSSTSPLDKDTGKNQSQNRPLPRLSENAPETGGLDFATISGLIGSIAIIFTAIYLGGAAGSFLQGPAILIVIVGTCLVTAISFSFEEIGDGLSAFKSSLWNKKRDPKAVARQVLQYSDYCYHSNALSLINTLGRKNIDPFLRHSLTLVSDGLPEEEIEALLSEELDHFVARQARGVAVLKRAAEVAPAMGLIGTLVGLIQMLGGLSDPETIGPAMAVALLTTFYGAFMGSVVLSPLASKIERNADEIFQIRSLYIYAACSIAKRENPRRLETLINAKLRPSKRVKYFN